MEGHQPLSQAAWIFFARSGIKPPNSNGDRREHAKTVIGNQGYSTKY